MGIANGSVTYGGGQDAEFSTIGDLGLEDGSGVRQSSTRGEYRKITIAIIVGFWILQYVGTSITVASMPSMAQELYLPRLFVTLAGIGISFAMVFAQNRLHDFSLSSRAILAVVMAFGAAAIGVLVNYVVMYDVFQLTKWGVPTARELVNDYLWRIWIFACLSGIVLALSYAGDIREREHRIQNLQQLAHTAQLLALRNQLNPHFLFNALNSISGLISAKRVGDAEIMVDDLADFLRLTLALDPQQMITLDEELHLQRLYLSIEEVRFPDRLKVHEDVPEALRKALVPSLITQPLIENSIKYAVAKSTRQIDLRVAATAADGFVEIVVANTAGDAALTAAKGARLGLSNVAERLRMHYGSDARLEADADPAGGFRNTIRVPLQVQA